MQAFFSADLRRESRPLCAQGYCLLFCRRAPDFLGLDFGLEVACFDARCFLEGPDRLERKATRGSSVPLSAAHKPRDTNCAQPGMVRNCAYFSRRSFSVRTLPQMRQRLFGLVIVYEYMGDGRTERNDDGAAGSVAVDDAYELPASPALCGSWRCLRSYEDLDPWDLLDLRHPEHHAGPIRTVCTHKVPLQPHAFERAAGLGTGGVDSAVASDFFPLPDLYEVFAGDGRSLVELVDA